MSEQNSTITIEQIEALAASMEQEDGERREKLMRMIRAYTRILSIREPNKFKRLATIYADEDGHYDNSYPPDQKFKQHTGPKVILIRKIGFDSRATSDGFYHTLQYYTEAPGLYVDRSGTIVTGTLSGTGEYGQFAAHPGECNVECSIEHDDADLGDLTTAEIVDAEKQLRALAFPLAALSSNGGSA